MKKRNILGMLMVGALLVLAACGKTPQPQPEPQPQPQPQPQPTQKIEVPQESQQIFTSGISFDSGEEATDPGSGGGSDPGSGGGGGSDPGSGSGGGSTPEPQPQVKVVNFTAPAAWTATLTETKAVGDWLKVEPSSGAAGAVKMTVTAQPNDSYEDRAATVTIKSGDATASFTVEQKGKPRPVEVTEVKLDKTELALSEGESVTLKATVAPDNATNKTVTWTSSDEKIATVDKEGKVTAVKAGEATITAKAGEKTAECKVKVTAVAVASVKLDKESLELLLGESATLTATVSPDNASDKTVTWSSSNEQVAKVDASGKVTTVSVGEAVITAKAGEKTAKCKVTVKPVLVASVTLDQTLIEVKVGESVTLTATVGPANATDKTVSWSSSDPSVATVDSNGKVTAVKTGHAVITAKAGNAAATCDVKVPVPAGGTEGMGEEKWD